MAERVERRLTTILAADVAEYSRLMRADEEAPLSALARSRAITDAFIAGQGACGTEKSDCDSTHIIRLLRPAARTLAPPRGLRAYPRRSA